MSSLRDAILEKEEKTHLQVESDIRGDYWFSIYYIGLLDNIALESPCVLLSGYLVNTSC